MVAWTKLSINGQVPLKLVHKWLLSLLLQAQVKKLLQSNQNTLSQVILHLHHLFSKTQATSTLVLIWTWSRLLPKTKVSRLKSPTQVLTLLLTRFNLVKLMVWLLVCLLQMLVKKPLISLILTIQLILFLELRNQVPFLPMKIWMVKPLVLKTVLLLKPS